MHRLLIPASIDYRYRVQGPTGRQKAFRITKFRGMEYLATVEHPTLEKINHEFKAGRLTKEEAREKVDQLVLFLYKVDGVTVSEYSQNAKNQALLEAFLKAKYRNRELVSLTSSTNYFRQAVKTVGRLNLVSAPIEDLQEIVNSAFGDHRQRRIVDSLNSILKWYGRPERLVKRKKVRKAIKYLPLDRIDEAINRIVVTEGYGYDTEIVTQAFKTMCRMAIYTGLRIGELMGLGPSDRMPNFIRVNWQQTRTGERRAPKTGQIRKVAPFPEAFENYEQWMQEKKYINPLLQKRAARIFKSACRRAWPSNKEWHLCFHDLRHSFAIACLESGMSLEMVARNLGNAIHVSQEYYAGYVHSDVTLEQAFAILNSRSKGKSSGSLEVIQ